MPPFAPPPGSLTTPFLIDIVRARRPTSSRVTPERMRVPPPAIPSINRSITTYPLRPVTGSVQVMLKKGGRESVIVGLPLGSLRSGGGGS